MSKARSKLSVAQQFALENERSVDFLNKLNQMKKETKESKQRTILNQQKLEWHKQFRLDQKREEQLTDELRQFVNSNDLLQKEIQSSKKQATFNEYAENPKEDPLVQGETMLRLHRESF